MRYGVEMFASLPQPPTVPCPECGVPVPQGVLDDHVCEHDRWVEHQLFLLRDDLARLDDEIGAYLASPHGRFELAYAERERYRRAA